MLTLSLVTVKQSLNIYQFFQEKMEGLPVKIFWFPSQYHAQYITAFVRSELEKDSRNAIGPSPKPFQISKAPVHLLTIFLNTDEQVIQI